MPHYEVRDGSRTIAFDGVSLASNSTRRPGQTRWTELDLYRTEGGKYVVGKVGRSVVLHYEGCLEIRGELPHFPPGHPAWTEEPETLGFSFHECVPDEYNMNKVVVEQDRYWALVTEDPAAVVKELHNRRGNSYTLPRMSVVLLERASEKDAGIAGAFLTQQVL